MATAPKTEVPTVPSLDAGVTVLDSDTRVMGALHSLVLDHLLFSDGECYWVDARGYASTASLGKLAPGNRLLERIRVARAFTAFQHHSIVDTMAERLGEQDTTGDRDAIATTHATTDGTTTTPSLLVAPALDWFYTEDDLPAGEGEEMIRSTLARLQRLGVNHDLPVLVTRETATDIAEIVGDQSDHRLACHGTRFGPRFVGENFETLVFEQRQGLQTTLAFWQRVLERRQALANANDATEVIRRGAH